ncbi:MAG: hypothetical protein GXO57_07770 [Thermodesulfobacteria bacterium]|nr:hypothetical protein [Thermodesulfobacteriota bacterium]
MIIKVNKGSFQTAKDQDVELQTDYLGGGTALAFVDKKNGVAGLCVYVLPYREYDIELDTGEMVLSGESLIPLFLESLKKQGADFASGKFVIIGRGCYKEVPPELDLSFVNFKVAKGMLKKFLLDDTEVILKEGPNSRFYVGVDAKNGKVKLYLDQKEEEL